MHVACAMPVPPPIGVLFASENLHVGLFGLVLTSCHHHLLKEQDKVQVKGLNSFEGHIEAGVLVQVQVPPRST